MLRVSVGLIVAATFMPTVALGAIRTVSQVANDLTYSPATGQLYVSVPSSVGATGNSVRSINPATAAVGAATFVGSEPGKVTASDNGQYLYVGLNGAAAYRRVDLATMTAGPQWSLGSDAYLGLYYVEDMEVMPGQPGTVAISRRNQGYSPRHEGVAIFDDGVIRPQTTPDHTGSNVIEFGANAGALYGYNNETTDYGFRSMSVTAAGVQTTHTTAGLIAGFGVDFEYGGGKVVSTTGRVIDPVTRSLLGTLGTSGSVAVEADGSKAFILNSSGVSVYSLDTFLLLGTIAAPNSGGTDLVRYGSNGLAFRTASSVVLLDSVLVPEPATAGLALAAGALALSRRRARR